MAAAILGQVLEAPEILRAPDGERVRIDDPVADRIKKGDPIFGWEGDERYQLYVNYKIGRWELWRHEDDGVMRLNLVVPGFVSGVDVVPYLIEWIVTHDGRRGFNPTDLVIKESLRHQREREAEGHARNEEAADRLHHALVKDVGHTDVGMSRRQFTSADVPTPAADQTPEGTT
jgi:hypothetical protein